MWIVQPPTVNKRALMAIGQRYLLHGPGYILPAARRRLRLDTLPRNWAGPQPHANGRRSPHTLKRRLPASWAIPLASIHRPLAAPPRRARAVQIPIKAPANKSTLAKSSPQLSPGAIRRLRSRLTSLIEEVTVPSSHSSAAPDSAADYASPLPSSRNVDSHPESSTEP